MKLSDVKSSIIQMHAERIPLMLWSPPGVGKTSIVNQAAIALGYDDDDELKPDYWDNSSCFHFLALRANLLEPVDFLGLPSPSACGERVKWLTPDFTPRRGTRGLLFIDELAQASKATQCAAMQLIDHLPDGWQVIAASNRASDRAGAGQVATHVLSRFTHVEVDVDMKDWQKWALTAGVRPEVRGFLNFRPGLLFHFDPAVVQKERTNCSPRSWHRASRVYAEAPHDIRPELLQGTVGVGPATEFLGWLKVFADCPTPDLILADPERTSIPTDPSALFAVCASLADSAQKKKPDEISPHITYATRMPLEFAALLVTDLIAAHGNSVLKYPNGSAWIAKHQSVFAHITD